jgi:diguanylate cyclase (GGDEF)-like protein
MLELAQTKERQKSRIALSKDLRLSSTPNRLKGLQRDLMLSPESVEVPVVDEKRRASAPQPLLERLQQQFAPHSDPSMQTLTDARVLERTEELFRKAHFDALTHLPNRAYFNDTLEALLVASHEEQTEFALLFLDLDGFKAVNDTLGHRAGDELLRHVAARLQFAVREEDQVFRLGGDEFVVLLPEVTETKIIERVAQRIIDEISLDYWIQDQPVHVSTSVGVARYPVDGQTASDLIERADKALYAAKSSGKGRYVFFDADYVSPEEKEAQAIQSLTAAIESGDIAVCEQNISGLKDRNFQQVLVSACWQERSMNDWHDLLVKTSMAQQVESWLLEMAIYRLSQAKQDNLQVAMRLWPDLLKSSAQLIHTLTQLFMRYEVEAERFVFYLPVTLWQAADEKERQALRRISDIGVRFCITQVTDEQFSLSVFQQLNVVQTQLEGNWVEVQLEKGTQAEQALVQMLMVLNQQVGVNQSLAERLEQKGLPIHWVMQEAPKALPTK